MLPKVASHIFHQTSRAAATAQNYALRNVLGIQPPASSGTVTAWNSAGSSSWGAYGAGPGGAKYNAGSRFYQGYTGAGRAVTQANGTSTGRTDDEDDLVLPRRPVRLASRVPVRGRTRSNSLTLGHHGRVVQPDNLSVLRTIQITQTRSKRTVAPTLAIESAPLVHAETVVTSISPDDGPAGVRSPPRSRRNSTSSIESIDLQAHDLPPPPPPSATQGAVSSRPELETNASSPFAGSQNVVEPLGEETYGISQPELYARIDDAVKRKSVDAIQAAVHDLLTSPTPPRTVAEYNMAMEALAATRNYMGSLQPILDVYNAVLDRGILPNAKTYATLIIVLCQRDNEVCTTINGLEGRLQRHGLVTSDRALTDTLRRENDERDRARIASLKAENNFHLAVKIWKALVSIWGPHQDGYKSYRALRYMVYTSLMSACARAGNVDMAIQVFAHLERSSDGRLSVQVFLYLLRTYTMVGDIKSAEAVFDEYRRLMNEGALVWNTLPGPGEGGKLKQAIYRNRESTMRLWNEMIRGYFVAKQPVKAISLLEGMLDSPAEPEFGPKDVPLPSISTYNEFIKGFISIGDLDSATKWFEKMLAQSETPANDVVNTENEDALLFRPMKSTPRPHRFAWSTLSGALAESGMVTQLNKIYKAYRSLGLPSSAFDPLLVAHANMRYIQSHPELPDVELEELLALVAELVGGLAMAPSWDSAFEEGVPTAARVTDTVCSLVDLLLAKGRHVAGLEVMEEFVAKQLELVNTSGIEQGFLKMRTLRFTFFKLAEAILQVPDVSLRTVLRCAVLNVKLGTVLPAPIAANILKKYYSAKDTGSVGSLKPREWSALQRVVRSIAMNESDRFVYDEVNVPIPDDFQFRGYKDFVREWAAANPTADQVRSATMKHLVSGLTNVYGTDDVTVFANELGPRWASRMISEFTRADSVAKNEENMSNADSEYADEPSAHSPRTVVVDKHHGRYVDEHYPAHPRVTPEVAWERYETGIKTRGIYPPADVIGRLIQALGRKGDLNRVHRLYNDGQLVLAQMNHEKRLQSHAWYSIENQMIVALAHAGDIEGAHVHRQRIIDQGGTPSSDAYGALIQCVKETTDDSTNALAFWQESQARGVVANLYLYNTIISKLSKARKADLALDLFKQMKANRIRPSSVTFGAIIAACCRVGDAQSAEVLFDEMKQQRNFKPRIPPYNTMIQFYTHIVRNRERALYYFSELMRANVQPTAHTYKLLIDCYGTIEPIDIASMDDVFARLVADRSVEVQGVHWAALINAYGCVKKDLDKAIEIFDMISSHPSTQQSRLRLPDAVTYESMINVLITVKRMDLIPEYLERLASSGVHMTAYIANLLIKGYAANGELERAREIFESLTDPPVGVAAPNNHQPHEVTPGSIVAPGAPVYREPSTWEAMVRAELGAGNRDNAMALLQRVQARQFPHAVYQRISGIMLDDNVAPWSPDSSLQSP